MDESRINELLDNSSAKNEPQKIEGLLGSSGPQKKISPQESRKRREACSQLLATGVSDDQIEAIMGHNFDMTPEQTKKCINDVYQRWADEDGHRGKYQKQAARRRIYSSLKGAREDRKWQAVAQLERVLSEIEGTIEPVEINISSHVRVTGAVLNVLGGMDEDRIRALITQERKLIELSNEQTKLLPTKTVDI